LAPHAKVCPVGDGNAVRACANPERVVVLSFQDELSTKANSNTQGNRSVAKGARPNET